VNARRARIGVLGTFLSDWNYALIYDFGGSADGFGGTVSSSSTITTPPGGTVTTATGLLPGGGTSGIENAYISYTGFKPYGVNVAVEGGYMDVPWTLDNAMSSNDILFLERPSSNVIANNIAAGDFRSAGGFRAYNDWLWGGVYATGPVSGVQHSGSSLNPHAMTEQYGAVARLASQVLNTKEYSFHVGGNAEALFKPPLDRITGATTLTLSDRPELRIDPTAILTTGGIASVNNAQVYGAEAAASWGPVFVQGEYYWYNVDRLGTLPSLKFNGGYVEASWTLTGEQHAYNTGSAAYGGIVPNNPVSITNYGGWGAWEIAGRYSVVDLNDRIGFADGIAGGQQTIYTAGLNWYATRNVRFMFNYLHGTIDKQASPLVITDVGAKFDAGAMRMQVAF
jgi:phosphate-selective porin OprO/OprP